jgi:hypothetical protein
MWDRVDYHRNHKYLNWITFEAYSLNVIIIYLVIKSYLLSGMIGDDISW